MGAVPSVRADSRRNRSKILEAASAVFGAKGAIASTEDVATQAGLGIATVFRHFPTKQALLEAVVLARLEHLVEAARSILAEERPDGFFALFALFIGEAAHKRVFGDVLMHAGNAFKNANAAILVEFWAIFSMLILRGQLAGLIRRDFDVEDMRALMAGAHRALQEIGDDPARRQRLLDILMHGIRP